MTRTDGWTEIANPWAPDGAKSSLHEFVEVAYKVYFPACANLCLGYDRCCEEGGEEQGRGWSHGHRSTYNVCPCCWRSGIDLNNILMLLQVTDTQGSEPRLSPRLSPLMRCYTTTATAVYTCTQHVHTQQQHTCTVYIMWCSVSSHVLTICKHKSWSQLLSSVHVFFNKFNFVMDVHASMLIKVRIQSHFCVFNSLNVFAVISLVWLTTRSHCWHFRVLGKLWSCFLLMLLLRRGACADHVSRVPQLLSPEWTTHIQGCITHHTLYIIPLPFFLSFVLINFYFSWGCNKAMYIRQHLKFTLRHHLNWKNTWPRAQDRGQAPGAVEL